ncbi:MAG TPA: DUF2207 domain-containing protein [Propionibacterium sp.]|nr:DUF2207 domain-containing protein [Propionibacterium sp.]
MTTARTILGRLAAAVALTLALVAAPLPAHAATEVESYLVEARIDADGALHVEATITPTGGPGELVQRFATTLPTTESREFRFTLDDVRATAGGADAEAQVRADGAYQVVTIPVADEPVVLSYTVRGAAIPTAEATTVTWRLLQGLNLPVRTFEANVATPAPFTMVDCAAGPPGAPGACSWYAGGTHDNPTPTFHDGPRGAGEVVQVVVRFPQGTVAANADVVQLWSLDRAFSLAPLALAVALGLGGLGLAGLWLLRRRFLSDAEADATPTIVGTFRPAGAGHAEFQVGDGVRPGQVGTLVDGVVDPVDVTATLVDLAVHGHLLIRELPHRSAYARAEWEFERRAGERPLRPYEQTLLDAIAPEGEVVRCSQLGECVGSVLPTVQSQLYDDVVERGWFSRRPDATRSALTRLGWVLLGAAVVVALLLVGFTTFGVAGLVLVALAAGFGLVAQDTPARTRDGAGVLSGLGLLRGNLLTQPVEEMPPGREVEELSEVLPYAIVLGGTDRWLDGLAATDDDPTPDETELDWYHGPAGWHLADLPDSLRNFVTTVEGSLLQR